MRFAGLVDVLVPNEIEVAVLSGIGGRPAPGAAASLRRAASAAR